MNDKYKYRMVGGLGYEVSFSVNSKPAKGLNKHLSLPKATSDIIIFSSKYLESYGNLNRAWFSNSELIPAYPTIPMKALDLDHELEQIKGHLFTHAYVDRNKNSIIDVPNLKDPFPEDSPIDVIVGGVVYVDRFPDLEILIPSRAYSLSMEVWFEDWEIMLPETGLRLTQAEAISAGLEGFIDQLMASYKTKEEFDEAHKLLIHTGAKEPVKMEIYKYLKGLLFSGGGLTFFPACPSCNVLATDRDEEEACSCGGQMAASTNKDIKLYELDLNKVEAYKKMKREQNKPNQVQVADTINTQPPPGGPTPDATQTDPNLTAPSICPQYKERMFEGNTDPLTGGDTPIHEHWCLYAEQGCEVAGDRQDKGCFRWLKDVDGNTTDLFDTRNFAPGVGEPTVDETVVEEDYNVAKRSFSNLIKYHELTLQKIKAAREKEEAATWTGEYINGLPNSSFAVVETGYKAGESSKSARHLPYKDSGGKVDLPHLRNALARMNQIKSVLGNDTDAELRAKAKRKLAPLAKKHFPDTTVTED